MSVRDLRDLINMTEEKIKQKMEQRDSLANNRSDARLSAQNSSNSSIIVQLSLKDLVDRYCHEQQLNPVIQNCNVIIDKVNNHPQGDLFRIQNLWNLIYKGEWDGLFCCDKFFTIGIASRG